MKIPKFIRKLYTKPLNCHERSWLYWTKVGFPEVSNPDFIFRMRKRYPPMTTVQYNKMVEREELYK
jgi:hypothetical protein